VSACGMTGASHLFLAGSFINTLGA
jgi:hypothetical protein